MKILWSVDPTTTIETGKELIEASVFTFETIHKKEPISVLPVYLLSGHHKNSEDPTKLDAHKEKLQTEIQRLINEYKLSYCLPPEVLLSVGNVGPIAFRPLVDKVQKFGADLIFSAPHGYDGFTRLISGSFTEALLEHSPVPLLAVSKKAAHTPWKTLIYGTDFTKEARFGFQKAVEFSVRLNLNLVLYSCVEKKNESSVREQAQAWVEWANPRMTSGCSVETLINSDSMETAETGLLRLSKEREGSLLGVASRVGHLEPHLSSSVACQLIEEAACPIWVFHQN